MENSLTRRKPWKANANAYHHKVIIQIVDHMGNVVVGF